MQCLMVGECSKKQGCYDDSTMVMDTGDEMEFQILPSLLASCAALSELFDLSDP